MGGHGGLNILPQKRWNVYNFDNREKVRKDEEEAAKEEQLKREQSRKRDTEFRIEQLRQARGLASASASASSSRKPTAVEPESVPSPKAEPEPELEPKSKHINLFEGIKILDPVEIVDKSKSKFSDENRKGFKRMKKEAEAPKVVLPEDEKYRLGYGVAGKGVKLPWYMEKRANGDAKGVDNNDDDGGSETVTKSNRKKSVAELREERLKREGREKERVRALMQQKGRRGASVQNDRGYSRRDSWK